MSTIRAVPSNITSEQIAHNAPDLDYPGKESEVRDQDEHEDQATTPEQPSAVAPEHMHNDNQTSGGLRSGMSRGECRCPGAIPSVNIHQFQGQPARIQHLVLPQFLLMLWRSPWMLQGAHGHCKGAYRHCKGSYGWIRFSQSCPGGHLRCFPKSLLGTPCLQSFD